MWYCETDSPVGRLLLAADQEGLRVLHFQDGTHPLKASDDWEMAEPPLREALRQLDAYFAGKLRRFDLPVAPMGTPFQLEVWRALQEIPFGQTRSYGRLAESLGRPEAVRAVGAANGRNPIAVVIPCHRVIGADGSLTGYGGGLPVKRQLLALEGALPSARQGRLF